METEYKCQQCGGECEIQGEQTLNPQHNTPFICDWVICTECGYTIPRDTADVEQLESKLADLLTLLEDILKWDGILPHSRTRIKQEKDKAEGK